MALETSQRQRRGQIYVALAAIAWSTAGVLQRQLTLDTSTQVFGRAVFAAGALLAYVALVERGRLAPAFRSIGAAGVAVAFCVAIAAGASSPRSTTRASRASCSSSPSRPCSPRCSRG